MHTPLREALDKHISNTKFGFHMPGHRGRYSKYDLTELQGLDNLHDAKGAILDSEREIAQVYGAGNSLFSTNGSTGGILAVLTAACAEGDSVIVAKGCHRSVFNAISLAHAQFIIIDASTDAKSSANTSTSTYTDLCINVDIFAEAAERENAVGVVLTRPNYYGVCVKKEELVRLSERLHEKGRFLFVDEAHGAHLAFSEELPTTALECGADCVVQSVHKTMDAISQCALIHTSKESLISIDRIRKQQKRLLTSSPSYMLMESTEAAVARMEAEGHEVYEKLLHAIEKMRVGLAACETLRVWRPDEEAMELCRKIEYDRTRVVVWVTSGVTGYRLADDLRSEFGIEVEMADEQRVVLICVPSDADENAQAFEYLTEALKKISLSYAHSAHNAHEEQNSIAVKRRSSEQNACHVRGMSTYCFEDKSISVSLADESDIGCLVTDDIAIYPPGSPIIFEGEFLSVEQLKLLEDAKTKGAFISGLNDNGKIPVKR